MRYYLLFFLMITFPSLAQPITVGGVEYPDLTGYLNSAEANAPKKQCGTKLPPKRRIEELTSAMSLSQNDCSMSQTNIKPEYGLTGRLYRVPLFFHVIHYGEQGYLSRRTIEEQVEVLNHDFTFNRQGTVQFGVNIEFTLAGIDWTDNLNWYVNLEEEVYKEELNIDPSRNINIYTVLLGNGNLGYAYYPQFSAGMVRDGITIDHRVVGGRDNGSPYEDHAQGQTLVHEMGHALGLLHTFFPNEGVYPEGFQSCENSYTGGDLLVDTNAQDGWKFTCSFSNACGGEAPIRNFMGYAQDLCKRVFTPEQANRMVCSLQNFRPQIYTIGQADTDGDGHYDNNDAFPYDPTEWSDRDGDGWGDRNDDHCPDDPTEWTDWDQDGHCDNNDDAFPRDPTEWRDTDGDGHGDNGDAFPNDPTEWRDRDKDGHGDNSDVFPNNPKEWADNDKDGVGNNSDAFPNDASETKDTDGDGVGDNADAFPHNPSETKDSDGDGWGDNEEVDWESDPHDSEDEPVIPGLSMALIKAIMDRKAAGAGRLEK